MPSFIKIKQTWLTRKPGSNALLVSAFLTLLLTMGSLMYWRNILNATTWMPASRELVLNQHEYWRLWTTLFAHGDGKHLLSNSFFFFILGYFLWGYFGFWFFPLAAFLMGGLTNWLVLKDMPVSTHLIGVSGVVFWMGSAWLTLYLLLDVSRSLRQRFIRALGVGLALFMPTEAFDPTTSYQSHWVGFCLGVLWSLLFWFCKRGEFNQAVVKEIIIEDENEVSL